MSFSTAKVFKNGQSQAIRIPKEFRFDTDEVFISKEGDKVILFPKPKITWEEFFAQHEACPEFELDRSENAL
jgi:antitoxin VapB